MQLLGSRGGCKQLVSIYHVYGETAQVHHIKKSKKINVKVLIFFLAGNLLTCKSAHLCVPEAESRMCQLPANTSTSPTSVESIILDTCEETYTVEELAKLAHALGQSRHQAIGKQLNKRSSFIKRETI